MLNRLQVPGILFVMAVLHGAVPAGAQPRTNDQSPNVLLIMADDLNRALGCYGHPTSLTPHLDALAESGVRFELAYCQFPVCGPSRTSIMTGLYPLTTGVLQNSRRFRETGFADHITLPQAFQQAGYQSVRMGKVFHMGVPGTIASGGAGTDDAASWNAALNFKAPEKKTLGKSENLSPLMRHAGMAFNVIRAREDAVLHDELVAERAQAWLADFDPEVDKPFFLALGFVRPHVPLVAPSDCFAPFDPAHQPVPDVPEDDLDDIPEGPARAMANATRYGIKAGREGEVIQAYLACVHHLDQQVGKVLAALEAKGLRDNTVIVFVSDHGYHLGEHTFWQKLSLHEESVAVPLLVSGPGILPGRVHRAPSALLDLYPTLADLADIQPPENLQGISHAGWLKGRGAGSSERVIHTVTKDGHQSIRNGRYRYMNWGETGEELYDLHKDPNAWTNLVSHPEYAATLKEMRTALLKEQQRFSAGL